MTDYKFDPIVELLTTIVVEAMYQDMVNNVPEAEDTELLRLTFALCAPAFMSGTMMEVVEATKLLATVIDQNSEKKKVSQTFMVSPDNMDSLIDELTSNGLDPIADVVTDLMRRTEGSTTPQIAVVPLDPQPGDKPFMGQVGDVIPSELPEEVKEALKGLGLIEGEILKDDIPEGAFVGKAQPDLN